MLKNTAVVVDRLAATSRVLDNDGRITVAHHGECTFYKDHAVTRRRVWWVKDKGIGRERTRGIAKSIVAVKIKKRVAIQDIRGAVTHEYHIEDGKHINILQYLKAKQLIGFDFRLFNEEFFGRMNIGFGICQHLVHCSNK